MFGMFIVVISKLLPKAWIGLIVSLTAFAKREAKNDITRALSADVPRITDSKSVQGIDNAREHIKDTSAAIEKAQARLTPVLDIGVIRDLRDRLVSI